MALICTHLTVGMGEAVAADDVAEVFATEPIMAVESPDPDSWAKLALVDMEKFPWDTTPRFSARTKTVFRGPKVGQLVYSIFSPTFSDQMPKAGLGSHYHPYWEWGYTLKGDSALAEPVSPYQLNGMYYRKREGGWLTRPPYSLHGGGWTVGGKRAQLPYHLIIFEEGDGSVVTIGENGDHFFPDWPDRRPDPYMPDWKQVTNWTRPWLVDSQTDLEWEPDRTMEGRFVKWLDDDWENGFRSMLVKIPPGWTPPDGYKGEYFENANRMRYVIYGDMKVWLFDGPADNNPRAVSVGEDFFIYQPARSVWGYGSGPVSEIGAIWLEVTYAHGVEHGNGPIEEPVKMK
jgi:hypothetical protein